MDVMSASMRADRGRVRRYAVVSVIMLACSAVLRMWAPSPWAPRVNVRWADNVSESARVDVERRFGLVKGVRDDGTTWTYDLTLVSPAVVRALIDHPSVADTHFIDRRSATIDADAARGTTPLQLQGFGRLRNSPVFLWFVLFWFSSLLVSSGWLFAGGNASLD